MQCCPVSSGPRKIRTLGLSGRRKGREWLLCILIINLLVSDRFLCSFLLKTFKVYGAACPLIIALLLGSYAGRAKIEGATLTIHSVTQKDSGDYRCEVTASEDHVNLGEASVTLNVLGMMGNLCLSVYVNMHPSGILIGQGPHNLSMLRAVSMYVQRRTWWTSVILYDWMLLACHSYHM